MSQLDTETNLSEDTASLGDDDNSRFVPVSESIRYRKRAQSAEKKAESLAEQLAEARSQAAKLSEHLSDLQIEHELMHKLAAAGAVDLEAAVLMAKSRVAGRDNADLNGVVEQLKKEKQYLFGGASVPAAARKTAGAKERLQNSRTILETAAKKAATSGNRTDLHEYLKLRRNFL